MQRFWFYFGLALIVAVTAGGKAVCVRLDRSQSAILMDAASRLKSSVPLEFGQWRCEKDEQLNSRVLEQLQCTGYIHRRYVHSGGGWTVEMTLLVGPPGPLVAHRPEFCLTSREWQSVGTNKKLRLKGDGTASDEFFRSDFEAQTVSGEHLRIYYSWNRGGRWEAPESPRIALGGAAGLLKLQASTVLPSGTPDDDPPLEFLRELTALLHKSPLSHAFRQGE